MYAKVSKIPEVIMVFAIVDVYSSKAAFSHTTEAVDMRRAGTFLSQGRRRQEDVWLPTQLPIWETNQDFASLQQRCLDLGRMPGRGSRCCFACAAVAKSSVVKSLAMLCKDQCNPSLIGSYISVS